MQALGLAVSAMIALAAAPAAAISVQNGADLFTGATLVGAGQFTGVVGVRVQTNAGNAAACTGVAIAKSVILTAAHCLNIDGSGVYALQAVLPDFTLPLGTTINASAYYVAPGYNGVPSHGSDIAVIKLAKNTPTGTTVYKIDTGSVASDLGVEEMVGLGAVGTGALGAIGSDGKKRFGFNQYEFTFDQVLAAAGFGTPASSGFDAFGAPKGTELTYDFDSGLAINDVFGRYLGAPGLGYVSADGVYHDTMATAGDSGAPHFENGKIVGITSFGVSGALFEQGSCAVVGSVDPSHSATSCTNSSFGELGVDTRVSAFASFITSHITTQVPEPATWAMMIAGFGLVGGAARRQRAIA